MQLIRLRVPRIYCLIRASSNLSVKARLRQALQKRNFLCEFDAIGSTSEVTALASDFAAPHLGLHADTYHTLVADTTSIIHTAWPVNFLLPLNSFNDALKGVENMLQLANTGANQKRFIFCSSVASVSNALPTESGLIPEMWSSNPSDASPLGYSRSKWVAESIIRIGNGDIVRIGQLSGDRGSGVWNLDEGWPMMVKTVEITGCLPDLDAEGENITWLPVDVAGEIIAKLALRESRDDDKANVFTVANTLPVAWKRIVEAAEAVLGQSIELVEATEWIRRLDALEEKNGIKFKLLDLWKRTVSIT